jgi:hypothetical protein
MEPYFSQNFGTGNVIVPTKKQILHVRAIDFMSLPEITNASLTTPERNQILNTEMKFTVRFSNGQLNGKNIPITKMFNNNGSFSYISRGETETDPIVYSQGLSIPPYEQVSQVELKGVSFPYIKSTVHGVTEDILGTDNVEVCFGLDIPEFDGRVHSSVNKLHDTFAVIYYDTTAAPVGYIRPMKGIDFEQKIYTPRQPITNLNKFDVIFRNSNGEIIKIGDFTENTNNTSGDVKSVVKILYKVSLLFEFTIKA